MLKSDNEKLPSLPALFAVLLILLICLQVPSAAVSRTTQAQSPLGPIKEGIGVGKILIGTSSASDVESLHGTKYQLINKNDYSYRMDYVEQGLAFYYCLKDDQKRIFLIELHHGVTSTGITIGESTLKDVFKIYGEHKSVESHIYEYKGIQFYVEHDPKTDAEDKAPKLDKKVVEVDIVAPDKSDDFCAPPAN